MNECTPEKNIQATTIFRTKKLIVAVPKSIIGISVFSSLPKQEIKQPLIKNNNLFSADAHYNTYKEFNIRNSLITHGVPADSNQLDIFSRNDAREDLNAPDCKENANGVDYYTKKLKLRNVVSRKYSRSGFNGSDRVFLSNDNYNKYDIKPPVRECENGNSVDSEKNKKRRFDRY